MSLILAISTSSSAASISLVKSGSVLAEPMMNMCNQKSHTSALAPMIDELLASFAIGCDDIDCFAVDTGPGSFTGVRIGIATVNGLALGSGKPIIGISSLLALRYHQQEISPIATIIDAHNENVYAALYYNKTAVIEPCSTTIHDIILQLPSDTLCIGDGAAAYQSLITEMQPTAKFAMEENNLIRASCVGLAAWDKITECGSIEAASTSIVLPTYLKLSQAELKHLEDDRIRAEQEAAESEDADDDIDTYTDDVADA